MLTDVNKRKHMLTDVNIRKHMLTYVNFENFPKKLFPSYNPSTFCKILPTIPKNKLLQVILLSLSKMHVLTRS